MITSDGAVIGFAPQALGEQQPAISNGYFYGNTMLPLSQKWAEYAAIYKSQPAISTLIDKVSNALARLSLNVWDNSPQGGKALDTDSPFANLIAHPTNFLDSQSFYRWTSATYELYGEAFWYKFRDDDGNVKQLWPMHPSRVAVKREPTGEITYIFTLGVASTGILYAPSEDVVAFRRWNPDNLMRGTSRLESLRTTLLNEDAARRAMISMWKRGARPGMVLQTDGTMKPEAMDRLRKQFDSLHAGADNAGSTAVLEQGLTAHVIQLNAEELQYIQTHKANLEEACMAYDVPPPVVHILDHATYSNISEQMRSMYRDTMAPRLEDFESVIDHDLRPEFDATGRLHCTFALDEVLRGDFEARATSVATLIEKGVMKPAEARPLFDLPAAGPEADKLYGNAALVPLGTAQQRVSITEPVTPSSAQSEEANSDAAAAASEATSAVAAANDGKALTRVVHVKSTVSQIRNRMIAEHESALRKFFESQRTAVKLSLTKKDVGLFAPAAWDAQLAQTLRSLGKSTTDAVGMKTAHALGGRYSGADIAGYLRTNAEKSAARINAETGAKINAAIEALGPDDSADDAVDDVFDDEVDARAGVIAASRVAMLAGFAALVGAGQAGATSKTWNAGENARPEHAAMDGETVGINDNFSNGMRGPGDYSGGAGEVVNCNCQLSFGRD